MGQKVNPNSFRLGIVSTWDSSWYSKKDYAKKLHEDIKIYKMLLILTFFTLLYIR